MRMILLSSQSYEAVMTLHERLYLDFTLMRPVAVYTSAPKIVKNEGDCSCQEGNS